MEHPQIAVSHNTAGDTIKADLDPALPNSHAPLHRPIGRIRLIGLIGLILRPTAPARGSARAIVGTRHRLRSWQGQIDHAAHGAPDEVGGIAQQGEGEGFAVFDAWKRFDGQ